MNNLLEVKFEQFKDDFELKGQSSESCWIRYVNYQFFSQFQPGRLDTDSDLLEMICVNSSKYSKIQGVLFLLNDQILCEKKDIDDILQREKKGILELYFLTFDANGGGVQQVETLFQNIESMTTDEKWIEILSYAMSQKIMLKWRDNPVLNFVIFNDEKEKEQIMNLLKEWDVNVTTDRDFAQRKEHERILEEKTKMREERKRLYEESKKRKR